MAKPSMTNSSFRLRAVALAACCGVLLVGCGGSDSTSTFKTKEEPMTPAGPTSEELAAQQRMVIESAITDARTAVSAVDDDSDAAEVTAAEQAITAIAVAIGAAANVPENEKDAYTTTHDILEGDLMEAKNSRQIAINAAMEAAEKMAMETARKLYSGIGAPVGTDGTGNDDLFADYSLDNDTIQVTIGTGSAMGTPVPLSEDKDAMVPDLYEWEGKRYTAETDSGAMYEAHVYSNVGEAMEEDEFHEVYTLTNFATPVDTTANSAAAVPLVSIGDDNSAGLKRFPVAESDGSPTMVEVSGSYHGVSGMYTCTFGSNTCAANPTADGFQLGTVTSDGTFTDGQGSWMFKPDDPNATVMTVADNTYASYGWWLRKSEDDNTYRASAFAAYKGAPVAVDVSGLLGGTAKYSGGAAGKYALSSATGGTNDAGHFTAKATLEADFGEDMITGTIDNFMGADGMARNWSVDLMETSITRAGVISPLQNGTVWTMDGTAANKSGEWSGDLYEVGDDGVPTVATGTFYTEFGGDGKMVGAFGANLDDEE